MMESYFKRNAFEYILSIGLLCPRPPTLGFCGSVVAEEQGGSGVHELHKYWGVDNGKLVDYVGMDAFKKALQQKDNEEMYTVLYIPECKSFDPVWINHVVEQSGAKLPAVSMLKTAISYSPSMIEDVSSLIFVINDSSMLTKFSVYAKESDQIKNDIRIALQYIASPLLVVANWMPSFSLSAYIVDNVDPYHIVLKSLKQFNGVNKADLVLRNNFQSFRGSYNVGNHFSVGRTIQPLEYGEVDLWSDAANYTGSKPNILSGMINEMNSWWPVKDVIDAKKQEHTEWTFSSIC